MKQTNRSLAPITARLAHFLVIAAALLSLLLSLGACGRVGYLRRAERAYGDGRYLEVVEGLQRHERDASELSEPLMARYLALRGLSLAQLGEVGAATPNLHHAQRLDRRHRSLSHRQRLQVEGTLRMIHTGPKRRPPAAFRQQ